MENAMAQVTERPLAREYSVDETDKTGFPANRLSVAIVAAVAVGMLIVGAGIYLYASASLITRSFG
jgi:hypothetical protein